MGVKNIMKKYFTFLIITLILMVTLTACGKQVSSNPSTTAKTINIGYFPSISHAPAMIGIEKGYFKEALPGYDIKIKTFSNGSLFMDALSTNQIDIGYVGPGPVINRFLQGVKVTVISNVTNGEIAMVVRKDSGINSPKDLAGKIVATPATGCTHDLVLRKMLKDNNLKLEENGGNVKRVTQAPSTMMSLLEQKQIDAAIVSEPWASLMATRPDLKVAVEWNKVPWNGKLPATVLVVRTDFLKSNPEAVEKFIQANKKSIEFINNNKNESAQIIAKSIKNITNQNIDINIIKESMSRVQFTTKIDKNILEQFTDLSKKSGFVNGSYDINNLYYSKINKD